MPFNNDDPFARQPKTPSVSWKGAPVGTVLIMELDGPARVVEYGKWKDGNPQFHAVVSGTVKKYTHNPAIEGEVRSLWATIPSSLQKSIGQAQEESSAKLGNGSVLSLRISGETPTGKGNPRRDFQAKHQPGAAPEPDFDPADLDDEPPF